MCGTTPSSLKKKISSSSSPLVQGNPLAPSSALDPTGSLRAIDTNATDLFNRATGAGLPSMTQLGTGGEDLMMNALGIGSGYGTQGTPPPTPPPGAPGYQEYVADQAAAQAAADAEAEKLKAWRGEQNRQGRASTILGGRKVYIGGGVGKSARRTLLPA